MKAMWKKMVLAESNDTVVVEGNHYFPPDSVNQKYLKESDYHTICGWKGQASYYHIDVEGEVNKDAAWYYPDPKEAAKHIKHHVAFRRGIEVVE